MCVSCGSLAWRRRSGCEFQGGGKGTKFQGEGTGREREGGDGSLLGGGRFCVGFGGDGGGILWARGGGWKGVARVWIWN